MALSSNSSYGAGEVSAYAPPPPIALEAPPAPELAPLEYPRRPFELVPEFALAWPSCSAGSADDSRCAGLGLGAGFGLTALWRPTPFLALGGSANLLSFADTAESPRRDAHASSAFYGLLGRAYFNDRGTVEPYLELGLGEGVAQSSLIEVNGVRYSDSATGIAVRVGGGLEFFLGRHVRLGPAFDWTRLHVSELTRCANGGACVRISPDQNGHGAGFSAFSLRLSLLFGPGS